MSVLAANSKLSIEAFKQGNHHQYYAGVTRMEGTLSQASLAYLRDHQVGGRALFPAAAMLETASAAIVSAFGSSAGGYPSALVAVTIPAPLQLPSANPPSIAVALDPGTAALSVESAGSGKGCATHLRCRVGWMAESDNNEDKPLASLGTRLARVLSLTGGRDLVHAPAAFGGVSQRQGRQAQEYICDPAILDNGTQVCILGLQ